MLRIGSIKLDVPIIQAPLSGYTDWAMRFLAKEFGAPLTFTGVMLAKSVINPKVLRKPEFQPGMGEDSFPTGAQILGREPEYMVEAAKQLEAIGYDMIDLNFACPAPKVLRRHRGGYLLKTPERTLDIYRQVRDAIKCPLTVKLRIGYGEGEQSQDCFWQIIDGLAKENADAIVIHGRTTLQKYTGKANWARIEEVKKKHPHINIIGSGDIYNAQDVANRLEETNLDGILIARGAIGNPWIFTETRALLEGKEIPAAPSIEELGKVMLHYFTMLKRIYPADKAVRYFRKFAAGFCKRHPIRKKSQIKIYTSNNEQEFYDAIKETCNVSIEDFDTSKFDARF